MNIPKVRFHGFKEKWREESLSKLFVERHEISTITESLPQLSFTISEGVIYPDDRKSNKRDFLIKDILSKKYLITCVGDILYNPANVIYGAIHRNSLCDGVVSPIYKIFKTEQDSNFMECVVRNPSFISQLSMKTEGTVTKLKTLKPESFLEMIVKIAPSIYEQRKIASYFQTLDSLIQTTSKKLASLKQIKAASLQSMFPQEGETLPKVRFKGFKGEWERCSLGSLSMITKGEQINKLDLYTINKYYVLNGGITPSGYTNKYNTEANTISISEGGNSCGYVNFNNEKFWSGGHCYTLQKIKADLIKKEFLYCYLKHYENDLMNLRVGSGLPNIQKSSLYSFYVIFPSLEEQETIAKILSTQDKEIKLLQKELEEEKQKKKALMQLLLTGIVRV